MRQHGAWTQQPLNSRDLLPDSTDAAVQVGGFGEDDSMDFDVFNQLTGERLGLFTVRVFTYWEGIYSYAHLQASTQEGSFSIDPTSTPSTSRCGTTTTTFTLHG